MSEAFGPPLPDDPRSTTGEIAAWWFVQAFCQFKFVSLYSLLFGAGMVILFDRIRAAKHAWPVLLRRLAILFAFGVLHAVLLWHGDILVCYAIMGLCLLPLLRLRGIVLIVVGVVVLVGSTVFQVISIRSQLAAWETDDFAWMFEPGSAGHEDVDVGSLSRVIHLSRLVATDSTDPAVVEFETRVLRDGPYVDACVLRAVVAGTLELEGFLGWNWHVLALFLFGAGAMRLGFFGETGRRWRRWALVLLPIGLLGENLWAWMLLRGMSEWDPRIYAWEPYRAVTAVMTMLGYVGAISIILDGLQKPGCASTPRPLSILTTTGRMGLSGYIGESVLAAFVMYSWGLGTFGSWSRVELLVLTPVLFAGVVLFANLWSLKFASGPLEWLWRRGVHGRPGGTEGPDGRPRAKFDLDLAELSRVSEDRDAGILSEARERPGGGDRD